MDVYMPAARLAPPLLPPVHDVAEQLAADEQQVRHHSADQTADSERQRVLRTHGGHSRAPYLSTT